MSTLDQLSAQLDRLAALDSSPFPVISLYLDLQPNERGRDNFGAFLRKELTEKVATYPPRGPERESLDQDVEKIRRYADDIDPSLNGLALFACSAGDLFEAVPLAAAPMDGHRLYISDQPHLYPLARLLDQYPRYVALLADTNTARIFVFAANALEKTAQVEGTRTRRHKMGGWSQARYQRHIENYHLHHAKDVVDAVDRIVRDDGIDKIVVAGDEVIVPLLRDQLPAHLQEKIVDVVKLDIRAPERDVLETTIAALREKDAQGDRERVDALLDAYRGSGLACVGVEATKKALTLGQVDELLVPGTADAIKVRAASDAATEHGERSATERTADELVAQARRTAARVTVIEDAALLEPMGGVGALLRFRI